MNNIHELLETIEKITDKNTLDAMKRAKRDFVNKHNIKDIPSNVDLLKQYRQLVSTGVYNKSERLEQLLKKRGIRSDSGIVPIQVLTKPFWCPGKCIFCPNDASMPKSYINTEPGAMRALLNQFDPYKQAYNRMLSLYLTGHATDKIEMIVLGGTWDVYPDDYKRDFLKWLYDAANTFDQFLEKYEQFNIRGGKYDLADLGISYPETIEESMEINETAHHRIIGLTIETRPEYMTDENCQMRRSWGVTRLEMWLQSMFDDVLDANKRGHSVEQAREATHKMRQYGFKFSLHFMPGLYGSTIEKDIESFRLAYADPFFKPDEIKFYPTAVIPNTELYELYRKGEYEPLKTDDIIKVIRDVQLEIIPPYTRIKRLIRDIPSTEIVAGSNITNLRQMTENTLLADLASDAEMRKELYSRLYPSLIYADSLQTGLSNLSSQWEATLVVWEQPDITAERNYVALDTRAREIRNRKIKAEKEIANLVIRKYQSSVGDEYFISYEDELGYLYGFTRLLLPQVEHTLTWEWLGESTALIRELHVYGQVAKIDTDAETKTQHRGFGSRLMEAAEQIATHFGYEKVSVISWIWVREYYKKIGYQKEGTYMVKEIGK